MKVTSININKSIQANSFYLVHCISKEKNCSKEEVLKTMTYELLQNSDSELYAEPPKYVWSLLKDEENGNIELWLKHGKRMIFYLFIQEKTCYYRI